MNNEPRWSAEDFARLANAITRSMDDQGLTRKRLEKLVPDHSSSSIDNVMHGYHFRRRSIPDSVVAVAQALRWPPAWALSILDGTRNDPPTLAQLVKTDHSGRTSSQDTIRILDRIEGADQLKLEDLTRDEVASLAKDALARLRELDAKSDTGT